jgi:hypothetical protein
MREYYESFILLLLILSGDLEDPGLILRFLLLFIIIALAVSYLILVY